MTQDPLEECLFCGLRIADPCESVPPDICEKAITIFYQPKENTMNTQSPAEIESTDNPSHTYLLISNRTSEVVSPELNLSDALTLAARIRKCGGDVSIFKETKY
jgi:hypothetical protein